MALELSRHRAEVFVPDGGDPEAALASVTHLGIGAHADDLEIMAYHGIRCGLDDPAARFGGVVCTDGAGATRAGAFTGATNHEMRLIRADEQREAARRGGYAAIVQLAHPSSAVKQGVAPAVVSELAAVLDAARSDVVYTHNPMDAHVTHLGVCAATLEAIRGLPAEARPRRVLGCEGWRGLDWLAAADKRWLELGKDSEHWSSLIESFASQLAGRPFASGALGRAHANAVFREAYSEGGDEQAWLAVDLTPVVQEGGPDLVSFVREHLERFQAEVTTAVASALQREDE
jgi:LmbE family N-acetylglucosaminyl deacetylase